MTVLQDNLISGLVLPPTVFLLLLLFRIVWAFCGLLYFCMDFQGCFLFFGVVFFWVFFSNFCDELHCNFDGNDFESLDYYGK